MSDEIMEKLLTMQHGGSIMKTEKGATFNGYVPRLLKVAYV
jgi:hypothetical protein